MDEVWAQRALLPSGWAKDVLVSLDPTGRISSVQTGAIPRGSQVHTLLPAPVNVHSHAFQRAMAGLTEHRGPSATDSFWTWRQLMFRFLDRLTPQHVGAIAALVQMEMLEAGYATNVEFHYLHHQPGGAPYDHIAETAERICAAAARTGIGLTLLPVHYQYGGCDGRPLGPGQVRFGNDLEGFVRLREASAVGLAALPPDSVLGAAPHSLRAVGATDLGAYADHFPDGPLHMHLAEQRAEVAEVQALWGARPVEWALDHMALDTRWCLIHCTQMTPDETKQLARTGTAAGLCPITESNLGDGIFDGVRWLNAAGAIAIGSDSNIRIALAEELRTLDHSQRLRDGTRAALATEDKSTGRRLYGAILSGGARAAGRNSGRLEPGQWADMLALDGDHHTLAGRAGDQILDSWIFAGDDRLVRDVWSAGRHMVKEGRHLHRDTIQRAYVKTINDLRGAL
ncbi:MAG: formimidoylglutamate deiminase [Sulfitobacter sp.]|nr:formimidoylglutamate deiminase [Sulfitobacter sp.]